MSEKIRQLLSEEEVDRKSESKSAKITKENAYI